VGQIQGLGRADERAEYGDRRRPPYFYHRGDVYRAAQLHDERPERGGFLQQVCVAAVVEQTRARELDRADGRRNTMHEHAERERELARPRVRVRRDVPREPRVLHQRPVAARVPGRCTVAPPRCRKRCAPPLLGHRTRGTCAARRSRNHLVRGRCRRDE